MDLLNVATVRWSGIQDIGDWASCGGLAEVPFEVGSEEIRALIQGADYYCLESGGCCVVCGPLSSPYRSQSSRWFIPDGALPQVTD
jgi:hypothetical protein